MSDQAYHARGAGLEVGKRIELFISRDMGINPGDGLTQRTMFDCLKEAIERWEKQREPGADTGTTPSPSLKPKSRVTCDASNIPHSYALCQCTDGHVNPERVDIREGLKLDGWVQVPERGTTPPEGLRVVLESGLALVESTVAHVSHGGPTRADAEKWIQEARNVLGR